MTYDIKMRKWLWIALAIIVILGGGFTYWNIKGGKEIATTKTSPTPTKSGALSPSAPAGATATPTSGKTATPTPGQTTTPTPTIETKNWQGTLASACGDLNVTLSYPSEYRVYQDKIVKHYINIDYVDNQGMTIPNSNSFTLKAAINDDACNLFQTFQSVNDFYNYTKSVKPANSTYVTEGPTEFTVNGLSAIKFGLAYGPGAPTSERYAYIRKGSKEFIEIYTANFSNNEIYNTVINSINF